ncbi:tRNA 2-selenouridine(34) synthase MnmH [Rubritalea marina]|uniref:tRNA 2-selenouridine(34) synthase MnmH n=1 Tax=Rubritalea marina TaxID=361055 RepID=UPI00038177C4|nr:tRNA 2-selenouridine(34) synthase MnmH [Rubritalea marina]
MQQIEYVTLPCEFQKFSEIIDVRSQDEFALDHIPGAVNLPVLDNRERHEVGLLYKTSAFEARRLGAALVASNAAKHLASYLADKPADYAPLVYCWRGGMRSRSLTHILNSIGWQAKLVDGGYQSFRRFLIADLADKLLKPELQFLTLAGLTGVGKTRLLHALREQGAQVLDLEGLAKHKGSLLGGNQDCPQPTQKLFESRLWDTIRNFDPTQVIWTEAESNKIGQLHCPPPLWKKLNSSKVIEVTLDISNRITVLREEYPHFTPKDPDLKHLLDKLRRIRGNQLVDEWHAMIDAAQWYPFVESILVHHYDQSYRPAGSSGSNYAAPIDQIHVKDASSDAFQQAASSLIQRTS